MEHFLGIDVGGIHDYTALTLIRKGTAPAPHVPPPLHVIDLQRTLDTPFAAVAEEVKAIDQDLGDVALAVDGTGIGRGLVEELRRIGLRPISITITDGSRITGGRRAWNVPHRMIYEEVFKIFSAERYRIAEGLGHRETLLGELQRCEVRRTERGHAHYGVFDGQDGHGDLLVSLGIASLLAEHYVERDLRRARPQRGRRESNRRQGSGANAKLQDTARRVMDQRRRELDNFYDRHRDPVFLALNTIERRKK